MTAETNLETPRTDAILPLGMRHGSNLAASLADLARALERELADKEATIVNMNAAIHGYEDRLAAMTAERDALQRQANQECNDVDDLIEHLGLNAEQCRTEGGWLNVPKIISKLQDDPPWTAALAAQEPKP